MPSIRTILVAGVALSGFSLWLAQASPSDTPPRTASVDVRLIADTAPLQLPFIDGGDPIGSLLGRLIGNGQDAAADCTGAACNGGSAGLFFGNGGTPGGAPGDGGTGGGGDGSQGSPG
jgi:hypothetical protein